MGLTIKISKILEETIFLFIIALVFLYDVMSSSLGFLDEFVGLISLITLLFYFIVKGRIVLFRNEYYIILFLVLIAVIGLLSNWFSYRKGYETETAAIVGDFIVVFKAPIAYIAIRLLTNKFSANKVLKKLSTYVRIILYLLCILVAFDYMLNFFPKAPRYGIYSVQLFFQHSSRYAFAFAFIFLVLFPNHFKTNKKLLILVLLLGMLSLRVKFFGFVAISVFLIFYGKRLFKVPKIYFIVVLSSLSLLMVWWFWDWFEMYFSFKGIKNAWSRAVILYYSFIIGNDFFPLGTGFGTFSSYYSGLYYSWVYDFYGISKVYGISRLYWGFIADQYWPMVLAQFGYLGLLSMFLILYNYFKLFFNNLKANINNSKYYLFLSAILGLLLLLIDSTSDAIFTQQRGVVVFMYFALVINTITEKQ